MIINDRKKIIKSFSLTVLTLFSTIVFAELKPLNESELNKVFIKNEALFETSYNYSVSSHDPIWQKNILRNQNLIKNINIDMASVNFERADLKYQSDRINNINVVNQHLINNPQFAFISIPFIQFMQTNTNLEQASNNFPKLWLEFAMQFQQTQ